MDNSDLVSIPFSPCKIRNSHFEDINGNEEDGSNAIFIRNVNNSGLQITGNSILNSQNGIVLNTLQNYPSAFIENNTIHTSNNFIMQSAIRLTSCNSPPSLLVSSNEIDVFARNAITLLNSSRVRIADNLDMHVEGVVIGTSPNENYTSGIGLTNSRDCQITDNFVFGNNMVVGLQQNKSPSNLFCCNYLSLLKYGYSNQNTSSNTTLQGNDFNSNVSYGLYLRGTNSVIGEQRFNGNLWSGTNRTAHTDNSTTGGIANNMFIVNNMNPPTGTTFLPTNNVGTLWFQDNNNEDNLHCEDAPNCGTPELLSPDCGNDDVFIEMLELIAQDSVIEDEFINQNRWTSQLYLYDVLSKYPDLQTCTQILQSFWNDPPTGIESYYQFEEDVKNIINPTVAELDSLHILHQQIEIAYSDMDAIVDSFSVPLSTQDSARIDQLHSDVVVANNQLDAIRQAVNSRAIASANALKMTLLSIPSVFDFHAEYKQAQAIALDRIIHGEEFLIQNRLSQLTDLASLCDSYYGDAVFIAKGLLNVLGKSQLVGTSDCTNISPRERFSKRFDNQLLIYPNPVEGILNIEITNGTSPTNVVYYSIDGVEKGELNFSLQNNILTVDISNLINRLYILKWTYADGKTNVGKFIKIK